MRITRTSVITKVTRTRDLPVTERQLVVLNLAKAYRPPMEAIFPDLSKEDIDFLVLGTMPEDYEGLQAASAA